jgi:hypothetical protein
MSVKSELISADIHRDPVLAPLVQKASELLNEKTASLSQSVQGEWRLQQGANGNRQVVLTLRDATGTSVEKQFTADELAKIKLLNPMLYTAIGDLLELRSHRLLEALSRESKEA